MPPMVHATPITPPFSPMSSEMATEGRGDIVEEIFEVRERHEREEWEGYKLEEEKGETKERLRERMGVVKIRREGRTESKGE